MLHLLESSISGLSQGSFFLCFSSLVIGKYFGLNWSAHKSSISDWVISGMINWVFSVHLIWITTVKSSSNLFNVLLMAKIQCGLPTDSSVMFFFKFPIYWMALKVLMVSHSENHRVPSCSASSKLAKFERVLLLLFLIAIAITVSICHVFSWEIPQQYQKIEGIILISKTFVI